VDVRVNPASTSLKAERLKVRVANAEYRERLGNAVHHRQAGPLALSCDLKHASDPKQMCCRGNDTARAMVRIRQSWVETGEPADNA
jgi:hypothetical protein